MKTTLNLRDELLRRAKSRAAEEQISLTRMIEEGLVLRLEPRERIARPLADLPVSPSAGGLRPDVEGTSNRSMLDAADDDT